MEFEIALLTSVPNRSTIGVSAPMPRFRGRLGISHRSLFLNLDSVRYAPPALRELVRLRDKNRCHYCARYVANEDANSDHVIPWKYGGTTTRDNLVYRCQPCNKRKGNKSVNLKASLNLVVLCEHKTSPYCEIKQCMVSRGVLWYGAKRHAFKKRKEAIRKLKTAF